MNDERPIEKLLRRFARKRQADAGAPLELHPANRRALQAEVARQYPQPRRARGWFEMIFTLSGGKLAYAAAALAVLGVSVALIWQSLSKNPRHDTLAFKSESRSAVAAVADDETSLSAQPERSLGLAEKKYTERFEDAQTNVVASVAAPPAVAASEPPAGAVSDASTVAAKAPAPTLRPAPASRAVTSDTDRVQVAESTTRNREKQTEDRVATLGAQVEAPKSDSFAPVSGLKGESVSRVPEGEMFQRRYGTAKGAPAPATASAAAASKGGFSYELSNAVAQQDSGKLSQNFSKVALTLKSGAPKSAAELSPVLTNFSVEQDGANLKITDSDGSTYTGALQVFDLSGQAAKDFVARGGGETGKFKSSTVTESQDLKQNANTVDGLYFRVTGTNRTLNQRVNVAGNFLPLSNQNAAATQQLLDKTQNAPSQQFSPLLQNSTIQGRLQVGSGREVEFNAMPTKK